MTFHSCGFQVVFVVNKMHNMVPTVDYQLLMSELFESWTLLAIIQGRFGTLIFVITFFTYCIVPFAFRSPSRRPRDSRFSSNPPLSARK
jgi:hypothetical protein